MPIISLPAAEALAQLRANPAARWPRRSDPDNRIEPVALPRPSATFSFAPGATIFTIGSCFARNIEAALIERGFDVPTREITANEISGKANADSILNNYGVSSILNELRWAFDEGAPYDPDLNIVEVMPGRFADLHLPSLTPLCPRDVAWERRRRIFALNRRIAEADVAVITLGLVEVWFDRESGLYLNSRPYDAVFKARPGRFELHVLSYREVHDALHEAFELIFRRCRPSLNAVLTVSPVPLNATFSGDDVATANQYSKSVLRAAAEAVRREFARVDYFPSYESVVLSDRSRAWTDNLVHVRPEIVAANVDAMIAAYAPQAAGASSGREPPTAPPPAPSPTPAAPRLAPAALAAKLAEVRALYRARRYEEGVEAARALQADDPGQSTRLVAAGLMELGRLSEAETLLTGALGVSHKNAGLHGLLAIALERQGRLAEATDAAERAVSLGPDVPRWIAVLARLLARVGRASEARDLLKRAQALNPTDRSLAIAASEVGVGASQDR